MILILDTFGAGIAFGGKITTRGGFVFERTLGYHFWTPPIENYLANMIIIILIMQMLLKLLDIMLLVLVFL